MSHRIGRITTLLQRGVQRHIERSLHDPRIRGLITVTKVEVDRDLTHASVHVSVIPAERAELTMKGLVAASGRIRSELGRKLDIRRMPRIAFVRDDSIKREAELDAAIRDGLPKSPAGEDATAVTLEEDPIGGDRSSSNEAD